MKNVGAIKKTLKFLTEHIGPATEGASSFLTANSETRIEPKLYFLKLFGRFRDIPAKSRDIPPKKFDSLGFEGHTELFGPHPFTWKTPTPPENIRTQKFRFGFFSRAWQTRQVRKVHAAHPQRLLGLKRRLGGLTLPRTHSYCSGDTPEGATTSLHFSKCSRPFIQIVKSTLSCLRSCNPVGGTLSSTAWLMGGGGEFENVNAGS